MIISKVKKIMNDKGMTIRALVGASGLSDKTILRARSGYIVDCRLSTLQSIATFLACTVKDLFEEK